MILVDSSGWIEFFTGGANASKYGSYLEETSQVVTPTLVLYEVYKIVKRERTEELALLAAAQIQKTRLIPLSESLALAAADVSLEFPAGHSGLRRLRNGASRECRARDERQRPSGASRRNVSPEAETSPRMIG